MKRFPKPAEQIHFVTTFSDGKRALGMGRGNLLTEEEYSKLRETGRVIQIDWAVPYEVQNGQQDGQSEIAERAEQSNNSEGDQQDDGAAPLDVAKYFEGQGETRYKNILQRIRTRYEEEA